MLSCLDCCYAKLHRPQDWKPSYEGQQYDAYNAKVHIKETGKAVSLSCTLSPQWQEFNTNHYCGQWTPRDGTVLQKLSDEKEAYSNWRALAEQAEETIRALRLELRTARQRSAKRLVKLRTVTQLPGNSAGL